MLRIEDVLVRLHMIQQELRKSIAFTKSSMFTLAIILYSFIELRVFNFLSLSIALKQDYIYIRARESCSQNSKILIFKFKYTKTVS